MMRSHHPSLFVAICAFVATSFLIGFYLVYLRPLKQHIMETVDSGVIATEFKEINRSSDLTNIQRTIVTDYEFLRMIAKPLLQLADFGFFCILVVTSFNWIIYIVNRFRRNTAEQGAAANP